MLLTVPFVVICAGLFVPIDPEDSDVDGEHSLLFLRFAPETCGDIDACSEPDGRIIAVEFENFHSNGDDEAEHRKRSKRAAAQASKTQRTAQTVESVRARRRTQGKLQTAARRRYHCYANESIANRPSFRLFKRARPCLLHRRQSKRTTTMTWGFNFVCRDVFSLSFEHRRRCGTVVPVVPLCGISYSDGIFFPATASFETK